MDPIGDLRTVACWGVESALRRYGADDSETGATTVHAETSDVAFRLILAIGDLWDGLHRAGVDPGGRGLHVSREYLGGYTRYSAGPASHPRLVVEWNESSRHLRVLRCEAWTGVEALVSSTVAYVRAEARTKGLIDVVDAALRRACEEPLPTRRTVVHSAMAAAQPHAAALRRA